MGSVAIPQEDSMRWLVLLACAMFALGPSVWADDGTEDVEGLRQDMRELKGLVEELRATVRTQAGRIAELETGRPPAMDVPGEAAGAPRDQLAQAPAGTLTSAQKGAMQRQSSGSLSAFNPEIGVLADIVATASESSEDAEGNDKISAREVELVFGHPIDPYSRLDVTATFSDFEEPSLEEAYITHWGLPGEIRGRIGRLRPKVGKATALHRDSLDTVDEPLVVANYLGIEGLSRSGVEFTGFLPLPWDAVTHELTLGAMEGGVGEEGTLFGETRRRPSYYGHLKNFVDLTDETNVELGATYLTGSKDDDSDLEVQALGLDATLVHYLSPNNKLKWQTEAYLQDRDEAFETDEDTGETTLFSNDPWGVYSLVDVRLSPRVGVGGRFDYVEPVDTDPAELVRDGDTAWSSYVTFYQSEFARWRLQYRHTEFAAGGEDDSVFLQGTVAIGVHKHQLQ
jgi:hypothetical protein